MQVNIRFYLQSSLYSTPSTITAQRFEGHCQLGIAPTSLPQCSTPVCAVLETNIFCLRSRKELREKGPPKVLQQLKDVVLLEGSAAKLECRVSAFPDPFIVWSKDGKQLKDGPKYRYVFEDPDVVALVVRDGVLADLGRYTVTIKNPFGETSDSACIKVEGV